jgi:energy-converting hydrogenase Eha subunit H
MNTTLEPGINDDEPMNDFHDILMMLLLLCIIGFIYSLIYCLWLFLDNRMENITIQQDIIEQRRRERRHRQLEARRASSGAIRTSFV